MLSFCVKVFLLVSVLLVVKAVPLNRELSFCELLSKFFSSKPEDSTTDVVKSPVSSVLQHCLELSAPKNEGDENMAQQFMCREIEIFGKLKCAEKPNTVIQDLNVEGEHCHFYNKVLASIPDAQFVSLGETLDHQAIPSIVYSYMKNPQPNSYEDPLTDCKQLCSVEGMEPVCQLAVQLYLPEQDIAGKEQTVPATSEVTVQETKNSQVDSTGDGASKETKQKKGQVNTTSDVTSKELKQKNYQTESTRADVQPTHTEGEQSQKANVGDANAPQNEPVAKPQEDALQADVDTQPVKSDSPTASKPSKDEKLNPADNAGKELTPVQQPSKTAVLSAETAPPKTDANVVIKNNASTTVQKQKDSLPKDTGKSAGKQVEGKLLTNPTNKTTSSPSITSTITTTISTTTTTTTTTLSTSAPPSVSKNEGPKGEEDSEEDNPTIPNPSETVQPPADSPTEAKQEATADSKDEKSKDNVEPAEKTDQDSNPKEEEMKPDDHDLNNKGNYIGEDDGEENPERDVPEEDNLGVPPSANKGDSFNNNPEGDNDGLQEANELLDSGRSRQVGEFPKQENNHFFAYFLTVIIIIILMYLVVHNKQKILGLIVEGRGGQRRRSHSYRKLDTEGSKGSQMIF